jgi:type II secretory pathway component PulJ
MELMVVLIIMGVVLTAVYSLFRSQQTTYINQDSVVEMRQNVRAAVDMMGQEMRQAGLCGSANRPTNPIFGIVQATGTLIQFTTDVNMNAALADGSGVLDTDETLTYEFAQDETGNWVLFRDAERTANGVNPVNPQRLARNLRQNPDNVAQFVYFMIADGTFRDVVSDPPLANYATSDPLIDAKLTGGNQNRLDAIRRIRVTLTGRTSRRDQTGQFRDYTLSTDIGLRNLNYLRN